MQSEDRILAAVPREVAEAHQTAGQVQRSRCGFLLRASVVVSRGEAIAEKKNRSVQCHDVVIDLSKKLQAAGKPLFALSIACPRGPRC
jgi:hypothetical protein